MPHRSRSQQNWEPGLEVHGLRAKGSGQKARRAKPPKPRSGHQPSCFAYPESNLSFPVLEAFSFCGRWVRGGGWEGRSLFHTEMSKA